MAKGRKPNLERHRQVADLHAQGLAVSEIALQLQLPAQAVYHVLREVHRRPSKRSVRCWGCGLEIVSPGALPRNQGQALCLPCLSQRPEAPFSQRLQSVRLAANFSPAELAQRAGLDPTIIRRYEEGTEPRWANLLKLVHVLGISLIVLPPRAPDLLRDGTRELA